MSSIDRQPSGPEAGPAAAGPDRAPETAAGIMLLAVWFGVFTGLGILCAYVVGKLVRNTAVYVDPQLVWTAPAGSVVLFCAAALILLGFGLLTPRARSTTVVLATFFSLAAYSAGLLYPRLSLSAILILSIGIGVQTARVVSARLLDRHRSMIRLTAIAGLILVSIMAATVNVRSFLLERSAYASLPAVDGDRPNVLLIILDTVRALNIGYHGYDRPTTPFLDSLAARSVVFENAFSPAPWTLAAHGSMFTGRWPFDLTSSWQIPLDDTHPVVAEVMADNGYATGGFVANRVFGPSVYGMGRGFDHYEGWKLSIGTILDTSPVLHRIGRLSNRFFGSNYTPERKTAAQVADAFLDWRERHPDRPYFAFLNLFDAHEPYDPPAPWNTRFGDPQYRRIQEVRPSEQMVRDFTDAYDGGIAYMDWVIRTLVERLDADGSLANTLVIVTSDHGEHLGERQLVDHGNSLYSPLLHVPLLIHMPGRVPVGQRIDRAISLRDIAATIIDLAGLDPTLPGSSLARTWDGSPVETPDTIFAAVEFAPRQPEWFPLAKGDMRSVVVWPFHLILNGDGSTELFDVSVDPAEVGDPLDDASILARVRAVLDALPARVTAHD